MELLVPDRRSSNVGEFHQEITPFPTTGTFLVSTPTAGLFSPDVNHNNLPPQKLQPIRGSSERSPSNSQHDYPPLPHQPSMEARGILDDGTLGNLGLLSDIVVGDMAVDCGGMGGCESVLGICPVGVGSHRADPNYEGGLSLDVESRISSGGRRPKKKIYHRVYELDRVMDLQKKPSLIFHLKSIIQSEKNQSVLLRDLEKQVGFVHKWNLMGVIEKYPSIFYVGGGANGKPPFVMLTQKAVKVACEEDEARHLMEPILVKNLRKLLMISVDCRVPLEKIEFIENELGLPPDFKQSVIPKYPQYFSVKDVNGKACLHLENWDSSLAVTNREERLANQGVLGVNPPRKVRISKDGNFLGPHAFKMCFAAGFRPNMSYLSELEKWQRMEFPSPYLNARRFDIADPKARKRVVGVLHELLSLTIEKRLTSAQLDAFHSEFMLPSRLLLCLVKHHGIFYITNKGARGTVFLKEAYDGRRLKDKCPLLLFYDKFVALCGRREMLSNDISSSEFLT